MGIMLILCVYLAIESAMYLSAKRRERYRRLPEVGNTEGGQELAELSPTVNNLDLSLPRQRSLNSNCQEREASHSGASISPAFSTLSLSSDSNVIGADRSLSRLMSR